MSTTVSLVGAGHMGSALLYKWIEAKLPYTYNVVTPNPKEELIRLEDNGLIRLNEHNLKADILVIAVKPQIYSSITSELNSLKKSNSLIISIMAGITIDRIVDDLGAVRLVRAMPNTPCAIGKGTILLTKNSKVSIEDLEIAKSLMNVLGHVELLENEVTLDIATAISGCGPAYVFMLAECMARAGVSHGLDPELSSRLARATVEGAGALLENSSEPPEALRRAVTSKGGITEAALEVLMAEDACPSLFETAFAAVLNRNKTLSNV